MERRAVLTSLLHGMRREEIPAEPLILEAGAEEYTTPLTLDDALHLLRRAGFGPSYSQATSLVGRTAADVVEELLGADAEPPPDSPGQWVDLWTEDPQGADLATRNQIERQWENSMASLGKWWIGQMTADEKFVEKVTLFWSGHWTSEFEFDNTYSLPQMLYRQYLMLRKNRLLDLRSMALDVTLDAAMLYYLGGTFNSVGTANENYARELMELFLTGLGNYTEGDVKEGARVLTGWRTQLYSDSPAPNGKYQTWFDASAHDTGAKQYMGVTIPARTPDNNTAFQVREEEVQRIIEILHTARAEAVSTFITTKVYKYFVYSSAADVPADFVADVAAKFRSSNFKLRELFRAVFTSAHFYDPALRGAQIKTPIEYVAGLQRQLGTSLANPQSWVASMDQPIMDPPNVSGWPGYRSWISTNTYPVRRNAAAELIKTMNDTMCMQFITQFPNYADAKVFVANVAQFIFPVALPAARLDFYLSALLQGAPDYDWPSILTDASAAGGRLRNMLTTMSKAPDFQLC